MTENRVTQNMAFAEDDSAATSKDDRFAKFVNVQLRQCFLRLLLNLYYVKSLVRTYRGCTN
jgi:hypothetical protein